MRRNVATAMSRQARDKRTMPPKRDWMELTWQDFATADPHGWIAVLPLAAVEQHGPHLPLGVDTYIVEAYLARARALLPGDLPAVLTVIRAWTEIAESVRRAGVAKLVIVTSHGGNVQALEIVARDLRSRLAMLVVTCGWHRFGYPEGMAVPAERKHGIHAGAIETSLMLVAKPELVRMEKASNATPATLAMEQEFRWLSSYRPAGFGWMTQDLHSSGAVGDATAASAAKGDVALDHGARAFVELLAEVDRFDLARLKDGPLK
jgi:creatinine amidohydrolase